MGIAMTIMAEINSDVNPPQAGSWIQFEVYAWNRDQDRWVFWSQHHDENDAIEMCKKIIGVSNIHGVRIEAK
jgi:hypothetical protein